MGWERRGSGTYYYRKRKVGGRVVSEYLGAGAGVQALAAQDARTRQAHADALAQEREERTMMAAHEADLAAFCALTDALVAATLLDAGYHRHHRGEWRKRRAP